MISGLKLKRWWYRHRKGNHQVVLLIPSRRRGSADPVAAISSLLPSLCSGMSECRVIDPKPDHISDALVALKVRSKRLAVLFAHPTDSFGGFEANGPLISDVDFIAPEWWTTPQQQWEILMAHVCNGQKVLDSPLWKTVFPNWVSYKVLLEALTFTDYDRKLWADIAMAFVTAAIESRTAENLSNRIRAVYLNKIADLGDFGNPRDIIHIIHFQGALDGIVYHQE
jgi:hypothetical protein